MRNAAAPTAAAGSARLADRAGDLSCDMQLIDQRAAFSVSVVASASSASRFISPSAHSPPLSLSLSLSLCRHLSAVYYSERFAWRASERVSRPSSAQRRHCRRRCISSRNNSCDVAGTLQSRDPVPSCSRCNGRLRLASRGCNRRCRAAFGNAGDV